MLNLCVFTFHLLSSRPVDLATVSESARGAKQELGKADGSGAATSSF